MPRKPLIAILGPTASGKTDLSLDLAHDNKGEIISADARQIYVGMDIGTDKIASRGRLPSSRDEPLNVEGIAHYLIDILTPDIPYSAVEFQDNALQIISQIHKRHHLPIVVGGTGLYVRTLTEGLKASRVPPDAKFRAWAAKQPLAKLVRKLKRQVPRVAERLDLSNARRVIRVLEIARAGETPSQKAEPPPFDVLKIALSPAKEIIRQRIEKRVAHQLKEGLLEEVQRLVKEYGREAPGLQAIAYREVFPYLDGEATLEETKKAIITASWHYARRQLTWLRKEPHVTWVASPQEARNIVSNWIKKERRKE